MKALNKIYIKAKSGIPVLPQLGILSVVLLLLFVGSFTSASLFKADDNVTADANTDYETLDTNTPAAIPVNTASTLDDVTLTAKAAYVWDVKNQRALFSKNSQTELPIASITKLMTALLASEIMTKEDSVIINETASKQDGWSSLQENEEFMFINLLDFSLMTSANEGAYALAAAAGNYLDQTDPALAFVQAMNIRAKEIGLKNTTFYNPTGLDIDKEQAGAYSTAEETSYLLEYIIKHKPDLLSQTTELEATFSNQDGGVHNARNTNFYLEQIPQLLASKTGSTELAGANLTIAFEAGFNRPIIITILGSTRNDRYTDTLTLVDATLQELAN